MEKPQAKRRLILRVRCQREGRRASILYAPQDCLLEEQGGGYGGFERWRGDSYLPIALERLLFVQRDLRLCLRWPDGVIEFADLLEPQELSERLDVSALSALAAPFQLLEDAKTQQHELWEYNPYTRETKRRFPLDDIVGQWSDTWSAALFDEGMGD